AGRQQADDVAKSAVEGLHERNTAQEVVPILEQDLAGIGVDQAADHQQQHESGDQPQARPIVFGTHDAQPDQDTAQPSFDRIDQPPNDVNRQCQGQYGHQAAHGQR